MKKIATLQWQALTSTISTTMVLVLLGILVMFVLTAKELRDSVREDLTVTLVISEGTTPSQAHALEKMIARRPYIHRIDYISSEQALKEQVDAMGVDPAEFLGSNPFNISMELHLNPEYANPDSLKWITRQLHKDRDVVDVIYQKELIETLNSNLETITYVLLAITVLLCIVCLSLINNTVRLSIYSRRFIINTMKLVGARWNFIRRPFMLRSLWIGLSAALLADTILLCLLEWLKGYDPTLLEFMPERNVVIMILSVIAFSLIITLTCTFVSVTHFLRMRENKLYR